MTPIGWKQTREFLRPKFKAGDNWIIVGHSFSARLPVRIEEMYYTGEKNTDLTVAITFHREMGYAIVAARKRHMLVHKFSSILPQVADGRLTERDLLKKDFQIVAPDALMDDATELAERLLTRDRHS